ncbi:MAG: hypothetical protein AAB397_04395 [Patescibacteria group bacterium]
MLRVVETINKACHLFIARDEDNINIIEFFIGENNLRLTREEATRILILETTDFIKFGVVGAAQFWKPENEEPEIMIYFYKEKEIDIIIAPYDEFQMALAEVLR